MLTAVHPTAARGCVEGSIESTRQLVSQQILNILAKVCGIGGSR